MTSDQEILGTARANHETKNFRGLVETYGLAAAASILANSPQGRRLGRSAEFWECWYEGQQHFFRGDISVDAAEHAALDRIAPVAGALVASTRHGRRETSE